MQPRILAALLVVWSLTGCAPASTFPPEVSKKVDPQAQFGIFNPEADTYLTGQAVQLGGRILRTTRTDEGVLIVAQELPMKGTPPRPADTAKPTGSFVILYRGAIDAEGLQGGNKFTLIGEMKGTQMVELGDLRKAVPYLLAHCLHVWKTGTYAITDFPYLTDGYYPLPEETYCVARAR